MKNSRPPNHEMNLMQGLRFTLETFQTVDADFIAVLVGAL